MIATWRLSCGLANAQNRPIPLMRATTTACAAGATGATTAARHSVGRPTVSPAKRSEERECPARVHTLALLALDRIIRLSHRA
jgi:hypothetical protein